MKHKLYTKSTSAWISMLKEIESAQKSIYIEMYVFLNDMEKKHDFIGKLKQKAREGIHVVIVVDSFGSRPLQKEAGELRRNNIEILFFSHWLRHIHRKLLIIDEKVAFIGGVNIGKRFTDWNDLQLKLSGKIAKRVLRSFSYTYEMSGGKDSRILEQRKKKFIYKLRFFIVESFPHKNIHTLRRSYEKRILNAQKNIQIITPYFSPPRWMISILDAAVKKGVRIDIFIPRKTDNDFAQRVNYIYISKLSGLGINFHLVEEMNHSKVLIVDKKEAILGSQNMDILSFMINTELGVFFSDKRLIRQIISTIENWKVKAKKFHPKQYKRRKMDYVIILIMKILKPIL